MDITFINKILIFLNKHLQHQKHYFDLCHHLHHHRHYHLYRHQYHHRRRRRRHLT